MLLLIISLNYVAANKIKLRKKEALVNSVSNVILPVYVDVFHLVSLFSVNPECGSFSGDAPNIYPHK